MSELRMDNETIIKNETHFWTPLKSIFKDLYTSASSTTQEEYDRFIQELCLPKLSDEDRDEPGGLLTYDECKQVLKTFQSDKCPGEDGFTVEFYIFFFELLGHNSSKVSMRLMKQMSSPSPKEEASLLLYIPRDDGSLSDLSNWRN